MDAYLNVCIQQLNNSYSSSYVRDTVETLLKIHRNIYFNKDDAKYKILQLHNKTFCSKVWSLAPARSFMLHCGWTQVGDALHFDNDKDLLNIINTLLENRNVRPKNIEWNTETKVENLFTSKQHEEILRKKAAEERQKEVEEFKKDKLYREQLAQNVKQQIAADRAHMKQIRYVNPARRQQDAPRRVHDRQLLHTQPMIRQQRTLHREHGCQLPHMPRCFRCPDDAASYAGKRLGD